MVCHQIPSSEKSKVQSYFSRNLRETRFKPLKTPGFVCVSTLVTLAKTRDLMISGLFCLFWL